jgi:glycosyltransferase involved in cell wall biosynthesis
MTLEILICTLDEGINNIPAMLLEPCNDIGYVVSWQHSEGKDIALPEELRRDDVKICNLAGRGLSRNRNNCIEHATADVCLISDDDCRYTHEQLQTVIDTYTQNPSIDIATFMYSGEGEGDSKHYPEQITNLREFPKGYYVSSIEVSFWRQSIQGKVWFNENFGLGTEPFHCGEENLFIQDALALELNCQFFPVTIVHDQQPLEFLNRSMDTGTLMAHGADLQIFHSGTKHLRALLKAWRMRRDEKVPFIYGLCNIHKGISYMKRHPEMLKNKRKMP